MYNIFSSATLPRLAISLDDDDGTEYTMDFDFFPCTETDDLVPSTHVVFSILGRMGLENGYAWREPGDIPHGV